MALPTNEILTQTYGQVTNQIEITDTLFNMRNDGIINIGTQIDTDSVYTGFNGDVNKIPIMGSRCSELKIGSEFAQEWEYKNGTDKYKTVNLRFAFSKTDNNVQFPNGIIKWSGLDNEFPLGDSENEYSSIVNYNWDSLSAFAAYSYFYNASYTPQNLCIVNKMPNPNRFIFYVQIPLRYVRLTSTPLTETDDYIAFSSSNLDPSGSLNIHDGYLPDGQLYNDDLWNKGWFKTDTYLYYLARPFINLYMGSVSNRQEYRPNVGGKHRSFTILLETTDDDGNMYYITPAILRHSNSFTAPRKYPSFTIKDGTKYFKINDSSGGELTTPNYSSTGTSNPTTVFKSPYTASSSENNHTFIEPMSIRSFEDSTINTYAIPWFESTYASTIYLDKHTNRIYYKRKNYYGVRNESYVLEEPTISLKECMQMLSALGCYFTFNTNSAQNSLLGEAISDDKIFLGDYNAKGQTIGTWKRGSDIASTSFVHQDDIKNPDYEPVKHGGGGGGDEDDGSESDRYGSTIKNRTGISVGDATNFITQYCLTANQLANFGESLWNVMASDSSFLQAIGLSNFTSNDILNPVEVASRPQDVMNCILSLRLYPLDIATLPDYRRLATYSISIGKGLGLVPVSTYEPVGIMTSYGVEIPGGFGNIFIEPLYGDWRDYRAEIEVFIPFCGKAKLPADVVMGTFIQAEFSVDFATGSCMAVIVSKKANKSGELQQFPVATLSGKIGSDVPLDFVGDAGISRFTSAITGILGTVGGMAFLAGAKGNGVQAALGYAGIVGGLSSYEAALDKPHDVFQISPGSDFSGLLAADKAYVVISYPKYTIPTNYSHVVGNRVDTTRKLSSLSGFTVCRNVDTSGIQCNDDEREEIKRLLESGVYL